MTVETASPSGVSLVEKEHRHNEGLSGKDAVLIHQNAFAISQRDLTADTLNAKADLAIAAKDNAILAERLAREHFVAMSELRREVTAAVQLEGVSTRAMVADIETRRGAAYTAKLEALLVKAGVGF